VRARSGADGALELQAPAGGAGPALEFGDAGAAGAGAAPKRRKESKEGKESKKDKKRVRALAAPPATRHATRAFITRACFFLCARAQRRKEEKKRHKDASKKHKDKDKDKDGKKRRRRSSSRSSSSSSSSGDAAPSSAAADAPPDASFPVVPISEDDYFLKNHEFSSWLRATRGVFFTALLAADARAAFRDFVAAWNARALPRRLYEGVQVTGRR
jgi:hypothetical protein